MCSCGQWSCEISSNHFNFNENSMAWNCGNCGMCFNFFCNAKIEEIKAC